jgi:2-phospho-L-lactate guanylyltransferase
MSLWAVIPLRGFSRGKSRLAPILYREERARLNHELLSRTGRCLMQALGGDRVLVVSPDEAVIAAARAMAFAVVREPREAGLNGALHLARAAASAKGGTALFSLSCDLPLLSASDIVLALKAWPGRDAIVLAPDGRGVGTNALIVPTQTRFTYLMGPDSAARHREAATQANLAVVEVHSLGLSFDLDTPEDLMRWRDGQHASAVAGPQSAGLARCAPIPALRKE